MAWSPATPPRPSRSGPRQRPSGILTSTTRASWSAGLFLHRATVGHQGHGVAVHRHRRGLGLHLATLQVTRRNPSAVWTSALARQVAADLAERGWRLERVMSDNASEFRSATFGQTVARLGARHSFIRAGRPQTNGCGERVQQTILDECWKPAFARYLIPKQTGLRLDLERYLRSYNTERAHTGRWTKGRTPQAVLGKAKLWHKKQ
jgi:transposase InsO family protein